MMMTNFSLFSSGPQAPASPFHDISKSVFTSHSTSRCRRLQSEEYADSLVKYFLKKQIF